jgi:hypothetical protein
VAVRRRDALPTNETIVGSPYAFYSFL